MADGDDPQTDPRLEVLAKNLAKALTAATDRKHPGMTHKKLEDKIGVSEAVISEAKNGKASNYRVLTLLKLASYCDTSIDSLLGVAAPEEQRIEATVRRVLEQREGGSAGGRAPPGAPKRIEETPAPASYTAPVKKARS